MCPNSCTGYNCSNCLPSESLPLNTTTVLPYLSNTEEIHCVNFNDTVCGYFSQKGFCKANVIYRNVSFEKSCAKSCKYKSCATNVTNLKTTIL